MRRKILFALSLALLLVAPASSQEEENQGPGLSIYPALYLKFSGNTTKNYMLYSLVVVNVSGHEIRDLTLKQTFPSQFKPAPASDGIHDYYAHPDGYGESIEGQTYTMKVPTLHRREQTAGFVMLAYDGRPSEATVSPVEADYKMVTQPRKETGPPLKLELSKYTKYSGSLADFLRRFAGLQVKIPEGSADWGFSGLANRMRSKTPIGIVEVDGDAAEGRLSLLSGAPGDTREILLIWRPAAKAKPATTPAEVKKMVDDQIVAAADFAVETENEEITKTPFARGEAWMLTTKWRDRVQGRLGEGPLRWYVYQDPEKGSQYLLMLRVQGRGAGPSKADVPSDEKDAALMASLDEFVKGFRPIE